MQTRMMMLLIMFLLSSCNTYKVCRRIEKAKFNAAPICDISFKFERCRCRCFSLSDYQILPDRQCDNAEGEFQSGNFPLKECEGISGFRVSNWASDIQPKTKKLIQLRNSNCN